MLNKLETRLLFRKIDFIISQLENNSSFFKRISNKALLIQQAAERAKTELKSKKIRSNLYNYTIEDLLEYKMPGQISLLEALSYPNVSKKIMKDILENLTESAHHEELRQLVSRL